MARMNDRRVAYGVLVWRPVRNRPLGRPKRRWEDKKIRWVYRKWDGGHGLD